MQSKEQTKADFFFLFASLLKKNKHKKSEAIHRSSDSEQ